MAPSLPSIEPSAGNTERRAPRRRPGGSLAKRLLGLMGLRIAAVIVLVTAVGYWHIHSRLTEGALADLARAVAMRGRAESVPFLLAERQATLVRDGFLRRSTGAEEASRDFARLFTADHDGWLATRAAADGTTEHPSVVQDGPLTVTPDLAARLVTAWNLLDDWGPVLVDRFSAAFIVLPEPVSLCFHTADEAAVNTMSPVCADCAVYGVLARNLAARRPGHGPVWTPVSFAASARRWMTACLIPGGPPAGWSLCAGQQVPLDDLIRRITAVKPSGEWSMLVDRDGGLIAHPQLTARIAAAGGTLTLDQPGERDLAALVAAARALPGGGVAEPPGSAAIIGVARIEGPGWYLIAVSPKDLLAQDAASAAGIILLLGVCSLIAELGILWLILRGQITEPIADLVRATERIGRGDFGVTLDSGRTDELGRLATAFDRMALAVGERDAALARQVQEVESARLVAENANLAKAEFLGTMSHELRTPLNGVIGMTELLAATPLTAQQQECVETVSLSGRSLLAIIDDILDFTKLDAGKLRLEPRPIDLRPIIDGVVGMLRVQVEEKDLRFAVEIAHDLPTRVYADPARIRQILANLVSNAVKFTERGSVVIRAGCAAMVEGKAEIHLTVTDTGDGIAPENLPLLGEKFLQLDGTYARRHGGTGLGLAITKSLLALMDGELRVTSVLHQGSIFTAVMRLRMST